MFKCCQYCLESLYWDCCEERFCYDESIAKYSEDDDGKCYTNHTGSDGNLEEPITKQPSNNNNLTSNNHRKTMVELPILAPELYKVFSKSMIFKDDTTIKKEIVEDDYIKPKTNNINGKVVTFKTDVDTKDEPVVEEKVSDFEIMFQDELYSDHKMFKIDEEEEEETASIKSPTSPEGIVMKSLETVESPQESETKHVKRTESTRSILRTSSTKSLLKPKGILPRSDSAKSFTRSNSKQDILVKRVNSLKDLESLKIVLARLPQRSASYLSIDLLNDNKEIQSKDDKAVFTISNSETSISEHSQISRMPDTPLILGGKLPKFFVETPVIGEYKAEVKLDSIKSPDVIFTESDFSMPRYYRKSKSIGPKDMEGASKSLPDLHNPDGEKMSKRISRLGSKLKPLIIKKNDDSAKSSQQNLQ